ncbi:MAG: DUF4864 domain-containing protein [Betaproteobacteria bacterium]
MSSLPMLRNLAAIVAFACGSALAQAPATDTLPASDWREIRSVVEAQRDALVAGNAERAYGYASRGIREQFGDAQTFLRMVLQAYAALVDAREAVLLEGAVIEGRVIQPMRLVLPDNTVQIALYTMEKQRAGGWRIAGCILAPSTLKAV